MLFVLLLFAMACGDDSTPADAGHDAGLDGGRDAGPRDGGPSCSPPCTGIELCCATSTRAECTTALDDIANCGECGRDCTAGRGTSCSGGQCACGRIEMGCIGGRRSWCCPPRLDGGTHYCANLEDGAEDCGGCGMACDPTMGSECIGGTCECGDERRACAGTPEDTCCPDAVSMFGCHDLTSELLHCGACGAACLAAERCASGSCTIGSECAVPCVGGQICCDGTCCERLACDRGLCGRDGGT